MHSKSPRISPRALNDNLIFKTISLIVTISAFLCEFKWTKLYFIVAFYDNVKKAFYSFDSGGEVNDFDIILVINSSWHEMMLSANLWNKFQQYKILLVGKFDRIEKELPFLPLLYNHENFNKRNISLLEKPLILFSGFK